MIIKIHQSINFLKHIFKHRKRRLNDFRSVEISLGLRTTKIWSNKENNSTVCYQGNKDFKTKFLFISECDGRQEY